MCGNLEATSESGGLDRGIPKIGLARLEWSAAPGVSASELRISLLLETPIGGDALLQPERYGR